MRLAVMVLIKIGEGGKAVGGDFFRLAAAVHLRVNRQRAAPDMDDLALVSDNVAREDRKLEIDAVEYEQDGILGVNILRHSEIGTLQKLFGATTCKKGLVMVQVGEFD